MINCAKWNPRPNWQNSQVLIAQLSILIIQYQWGTVCNSLVPATNRPRKLTTWRRSRHCRVKIRCLIRPDVRQSHELRLQRKGESRVNKILALWPQKRLRWCTRISNLHSARIAKTRVRMGGGEDASFDFALKELQLSFFNAQTIGAIMAVI